MPAREALGEELQDAAAAYEWDVASDTLGITEQIFGKESGDKAVAFSVAQSRMRAGASVADPGASSRAMTVRRFNKRDKFNLNGVLNDLEFTEDTDFIDIMFASDAYFEFIGKEADLREVLAAASRAIVMIDDDLAVVIRHEGGLEELDDDTRKRLWPEG